MDNKLFEVRAEATCLVVMATRLEAVNEAEAYLLSRSGYGGMKDWENYIILQQIDGGEGYATCDPYKHKYHEMFVAHQYIKKHFDELESGAVIDTDFIEGRTKEPKESERLYYEKKYNGIR